MAKFPKRLYVKTEKDGDTSWFVADDDLQAMADMGEKVVVAVYELEDTCTVEGVVKASKNV